MRFAVEVARAWAHSFGVFPLLIWAPDGVAGMTSAVIGDPEAAPRLTPADESFPIFRRGTSALAGDSSRCDFSFNVNTNVLCSFDGMEMGLGLDL